MRYNGAVEIDLPAANDYMLMLELSCPTVALVRISHRKQWAKHGHNGRTSQAKENPAPAIFEI